MIREISPLAPGEELIDADVVPASLHRDLRPRARMARGAAVRRGTPAARRRGLLRARRRPAGGSAGAGGRRLPDPPGRGARRGAARPCACRRGRALSRAARRHPGDVLRSRAAPASRADLLDRAAVRAGVGARAAAGLLRRAGARSAHAPHPPLPRPGRRTADRAVSDLRACAAGGLPLRRRRQEAVRSGIRRGAGLDRRGHRRRPTSA